MIKLAMTLIMLTNDYFYIIMVKSDFLTIKWGFNWNWILF